MPFNEVKELRKSGNLEEALNMAQQELENAPDDIWNKRSIAWVYHDYLKLLSSVENFSTFKNNIENLIDLGLPEEEKMIFDTCLYQVGKMIFLLADSENLDYTKIDELFQYIKSFHLLGPPRIVC